MGTTLGRGEKGGGGGVSVWVGLFDLGSSRSTQYLFMGI